MSDKLGIHSSHGGARGLTTARLGRAGRGACARDRAARARGRRGPASVPRASPCSWSITGRRRARNSMAPMAKAVSALRARLGPDRAISVVHTDLPGNDFTALFRDACADAPGELSQRPIARPSPSLWARSYFEQILPSRQRDPWLELVGDPVAEPRRRPSSRIRCRWPIAAILRRRTPISRQAGRGLADLPCLPRA